MGRAPCCEKMGLKKGPWSPEEDRILMTFIQNHGHSNWRALPKQAGLLRCGKSCRLRWTNYLRPDIKRGNFTIEEEDTIIKLHEMLGNRWSAIAAKLPGRTDNEIKNVWHTHLKKRVQGLKTSVPNSETKRKMRQSKPRNDSDSIDVAYSSMSPNSQQSSSEISSVTDAYMTENEYNYTAEDMVSVEAVPPIDESFWSETTELAENSDTPLEFSVADHGEVKMEFPVISVESNDQGYGQNFDDDDMEFWYDIFIKAGGISELPEF